MKVKLKETGEEIEVDVRKDPDTGRVFYVDNVTFNAYSEDEVELLENIPPQTYAIPIKNFQKFINDVTNNNDVITFWKYFRCDIFKISIQQGFDFNNAANAAALATEKLYNDCKEFENRILNNKNK